MAADENFQAGVFVQRGEGAVEDLSWRVISAHAVYGYSHGPTGFRQKSGAMSPVRYRPIAQRLELLCTLFCPDS